MAALASALGLGLGTGAGTGTSLLSTPAHNHAAGLLGFHFVWAYVVLAPRTLKQIHGIDHQASPRYDITLYGAGAVQAGTLTQAQLEMIQRCDSAHYNSVENYALLVGALGLASLARVDARAVNRAGLVYTAARVAYGFVYVLIDHPRWSISRGVLWWIGNGSCLFLLWKASEKLGVGG
ncbi:hypothetical protein B0T26DRAFT_635740 [Lasiosphaeria miniovina]|uniref:Uncharacterized protein n=1 Tax=Lasiosphaeria miniovina TaxID=1954250 RepID=A0AA40BI36_9PEZI|nr:uncharacterized protein B0T26DRAFT_635740 [Lasiosphaeria miniovina]KAK0734636.1 hypothetical protein B0T26DRAFT_635740 [Lasiosphaeria miniovina]